ncbi:restriction endonuclease subunit S [Mycoplasma zalophi]|uniref:restriction endonuclease subunit S n=1 Tax=Mycoplasma zalophi TaxID=191287 RepID=UPI001C0FB66B|nr:restriction endonuclease subunit S [Mycoplasma zalophi]MBU4690913.1 restriction endonuclease subunit S [Mycoplasma zalophi]
MNNKLDTTNWKFFKIKEIFPKLVKGKCSNAPDLTKGKDVPYIGAKKTENGVIQWCEYERDLVSEANCICFICQGAGSNGYCNYFDIETIQSTSNTLGYNKNLNEHNGLFIVAVADLEKPKWSFGRGRSPKLAESEIKLPAKADGSIDWDYMTNYIKELRERERERVLNLLNH